MASPAQFDPDAFMAARSGEATAFDPDSFMAKRGARPKEEAAPGYFATLGNDLAGSVSALRHPIDTAVAIYKSSLEHAHAAVDSLKQGKYSEASDHLVQAVPILGPMAYEIRDDIDQGNNGRALARMTELVAPKVAGKAPAVAQGTSALGRLAVRAAAELPKIPEAAIDAAGVIMPPAAHAAKLLNRIPGAAQKLDAMRDVGAAQEVNALTTAPNGNGPVRPPLAEANPPIPEQPPVPMGPSAGPIRPPVPQQAAAAPPPPAPAAPIDYAAAQQNWENSPETQANRQAEALFKRNLMAKAAAAKAKPPEEPLAPAVAAPSPEPVNSGPTALQETTQKLQGNGVSRETQDLADAYHARGDVPSPLAAAKKDLAIAEHMRSKGITADVFEKVTHAQRKAWGQDAKYSGISQDPQRISDVAELLRKNPPTTAMSEETAAGILKAAQDELGASETAPPANKGVVLMMPSEELKNVFVQKGPKAMKAATKMYNKLKGPE